MNYVSYMSSQEVTETGKFMDEVQRLCDKLVPSRKIKIHHLDDDYIYFTDINNSLIRKMVRYSEIIEDELFEYSALNVTLMLIGETGCMKINRCPDCNSELIRDGIGKGKCLHCDDFCGECGSENVTTSNGDVHCKDCKIIFIYH